MTRVEHQWLAVAQRVTEHAREVIVPAFGHPPGLIDGFLLGRVVIDVEVRGLQDAEVETAILHLVLAEVLRLGAVGQQERERHEERQAKGTHNRHECPGLRR